MKIQVLLAMDKYRLSKEEAGDLLDHRVHMVTTSQELWHSMKKSMKLVGEKMGE